ncbi:penicillin-binding protein 1C [Hymenobacter saemangeumensis]|uniref:penicillin-binding protein 1C n=1 Tax=Hymenobacter saemangeumensis TaxID=1084522 RepID=UPI0031EA491C
MPRYSPIVLAADGSVLHAFLNPTQKWRMKTELQEITPALQQAIIVKEDRYFRYHFGVNPLAILQAAGRNLFRTGRTTGASTITMQVARLLEPKERTFGNKIGEMLRAVQLEAHYSKAEILQLYLNLVPYGGNIEGVKSAALLYFQQPPDYLSLAQTVTLAIIPNQPRGLVLGKNNARIVAERNRWLRRFGQQKLFPAQDIADALAEPLTAVRHPAPTLAPHLARRLVTQFPGQPILHATLQRSPQAKAEDLTRNYVRRLHELGISQAAVLVVNNRTRAVEAYVGSADFQDAAGQGQVDGVRAIRSPGSTLKPFLYALAMDRGLVTPKLKLPDVPTNFSGFRPENFDKTCSGEVTMERALTYSLNIPAVRVLADLGVPAFTDKLRQAGFRRVAQDAPRLGLSTILGGCGATLEELTGLYVALANRGKYGPLRVTSPPAPQTLDARYPRRGEPIPKKVSPGSLLSAGEGGRGGEVAGADVTLVSPAAAFLTTEILTQRIRPDLPLSYESSLHLPRIAWKTGTSYGRRDAWSIGYNHDYTVGVWVGNFNGQGSPSLTGTDIATPLLFELFNTLAYNSPNNWMAPPASLDFRLVCAETGLVPGEHCPNQLIDYYLPGFSTARHCEHKKEALLSADGRVAYCRACLPELGYRRQLFPNPLPEVLAFREAQGLPAKRLPPHNPACRLVRSDDDASAALAITSPLANAEYLLNRGEKQQLLLSCAAGSEVRQVFWYVNDRFLRAASATERVFFRPPAGAVKISCADDHGRNVDVQVLVGEI